MKRDKTDLIYDLAIIIGGLVIGALILVAMVVRQGI